MLQRHDQNLSNSAFWSHSDQATNPPRAHSPQDSIDSISFLDNPILSTPNSMTTALSTGSTDQRSLFVHLGPSPALPIFPDESPSRKNLASIDPSSPLHLSHLALSIPIPGMPDIQGAQNSLVSTTYCNPTTICNPQGTAGTTVMAMALANEPMPHPPHVGSAWLPFWTLPDSSLETSTTPTVYQAPMMDMPVASTMSLPEPEVKFVVWPLSSESHLDPSIQNTTLMWPIDDPSLSWTRTLPPQPPRSLSSQGSMTGRGLELDSSLVPVKPTHWIDKNELPTFSCAVPAASSSMFSPATTTFSPFSTTDPILTAPWIQTRQQSTSGRVDSIQPLPSYSLDKPGPRNGGPHLFSPFPFKATKRQHSVSTPRSVKEHTISKSGCSCRAPGTRTTTFPIRIKTHSEYMVPDPSTIFRSTTPALTTLSQQKTLAKTNPGAKGAVTTTTTTTTTRRPRSKFYFVEPYQHSVQKVDRRSFNCRKELKRAQAREKESLYV